MALKKLNINSEDGFKEIGDLLKQVRVRRGETTEQVAESTKISQDYIVGLEEGEIDELPGWAYVIGYLRTYAKYIGIDPSSLVVRYRELLDMDNLEKIKHPYEVNYTAGRRGNGGSNGSDGELFFEEESELRHSFLPIGAAFGVTLVVVVSLFSFWYFSSPSENALIAEANNKVRNNSKGNAGELIDNIGDNLPFLVEEPDAPEGKIATDNTITGNSKLEKPEVIASVNTSISNLSEAELEPNVTTSIKSLPLNVNGGRLIVGNNLISDGGEVSLKTKDITLNDLDIPSGFGGNYSSGILVVKAVDYLEKNKNQLESEGVSIRALGVVNVVVTVDNQVIFKRSMKAGEYYTIPHREGVIVEVSNGGSLEYYKNNVKVGLFGARGKAYKKVLNNGRFVNRND